MARKLSNFFTMGRHFRKEFRKQLRLLIVFTLGFTIAFTWRQTTFDLSQSFVQFLTNVEGSNLTTILTSLFITIISVLLIYGAAYLLRDSPDNY